MGKILEAGSQLKGQSEALKIYEKGAKAGCAQCQNAFGYYLLHGLGGTVKNIPKAIEFFNAAIAQGVVAVRLNLAFALQQTGLKEDASKAIRMFEDLLQDMPLEASLNLAFTYYKGTGVQVDLDKALKYLAPHMDNRKALETASHIYLLKQDFLNATKCFDKLAQPQNPSKWVEETLAMCNSFLTYLDREGNRPHFKIIASHIASVKEILKQLKSAYNAKDLQKAVQQATLLHYYIPLIMTQVIETRTL